MDHGLKRYLAIDCMKYNGPINHRVNGDMRGHITSSSMTIILQIRRRARVGSYFHERPKLNPHDPGKYPWLSAFHQLRLST